MLPALLPLGQIVTAVNEEDVKPGWLGFAVVLGLALALVFLLFSFRKQLRKVDFEEPADDSDQPGNAEESRAPEDRSES